MSTNKGQFQPVQDPQSQDQPGFEENLHPKSEPTKLEGKNQFHEYRAANKLEGCKAFVTGGDSGIGRSVALLFAREGADVTIVYLPEEEQDAQETKKMVADEGRECLLVAGNLLDNETCQRAVKQHVDKFGMIHVLVNNASKQIMCEDLKDINLDDVESTFRSNIVQMLAITKFALHHMEKGGSIINTTSTVAFRGSGGMVDYSATKGAIVSFTRSLAKQLTPKGIRVNAVAPGPVHTPIQPASRPAMQMEGFGQNSQIGRPGQPSEVAPSFVFLASKDAELYYGQVLHSYPTMGLKCVDGFCFDATVMNEYGSTRCTVVHNIRIHRMCNETGMGQVLYVVRSNRRRVTGPLRRSMMMHAWADQSGGP